MDSLANKIERLNHHLNMSKPDLVVLTEHGLKQDTILDARLIDYSLVTPYGRVPHRKGGVAIYKHNSLANTIESHDVKDFSSELICEMASVKMAFNKRPHLYVMGLYRPPTAPLEEALALIAGALDSIPLNNSGICIVGDLNINSLAETNEKSKLRDLLSSYDIQRLDLPPTRITTNSISSIDIVCSNLDRELIDVEIVNTHLSDHTAQLCSLEIPSRTKIEPTTSRRHINSQNLSSLKDLLANQNWERVFQALDADTSYKNFINIMASLLDLTCLYKTSCGRQKCKRPRIYNAETEQLRRSFIEANDRYLLNSRDEDKVEASQRKKDYDLALKSIRRVANEEIIAESSNKSKAIWDIINRERALRKKDQDKIWRLQIGDVVVDDILTVANQFNIFFTSIAEETLKSNNNLRVNKNYIHPFKPNSLLTNFMPVTFEEVASIITNMKTSTSSGMDDISSHLLKFCKHEICLPLLNIINKSLLQGVFPSELKTSKVYPLHKQGNKEDIKNFRPISLVPSVSKIIERAVLSRLWTHLETNNLLPEKQHGFIAKRSTTSALVEIVEQIIDHLEAGATIATTFLDLSKAFDCLNHNHLLAKLSAMGIGGAPLSWFRSYLSDRRQIVEIRQTSNGSTRTVHSAPLNINRGVPQGSVLGPILFVLFTSDLPKYIEGYCHPVSFADDTVLLTNGMTTENIEVTTFIAVSIAQEYCVQNDLVLNESKTKQMTLGRNKNLVGGPPSLQLVDSTNHLGVIFDDCLSWNTHIDSLCSKLSSALFALKRTKATSTAKITKLAYHALFETHLRYGIVLWGSSSNNNLKRVLLLQKRALRIMEGLKPQDSCREVFKNLNILTVTAVYILEVILHASQQNLTRHGDLHDHHTRNAPDYSLPIHRTTLFTKKPSYAGARLFNMLPPEMKRGNPITLKRRLRSWLLEYSIYTLDEFQTCAEGATL